MIVVLALFYPPVNRDLTEIFILLLATCICFLGGYCFKVLKLQD